MQSSYRNQATRPFEWWSLLCPENAVALPAHSEVDHALDHIVGNEQVASHVNDMADDLREILD